MIRRAEDTPAHAATDRLLFGCCCFCFLACHPSSLVWCWPEVGPGTAAAALAARPLLLSIVCIICFFFVPAPRRCSLLAH